MTILVCGGAGYIGSHVVRRLQRDGIRVVVFDNLSTGHRESLQDCELVVGDLLDPDALMQVFGSHAIEGVMHFCARSLVGESVRLPLDYYWNNVVGTLSLLRVMQAHHVQQIVFSSTAAVYGSPLTQTIEEQHPLRPINPYGHSKMMVEQMLRDAAPASGLRSVSLRYFNAAGAALDALIGESHAPETHLIPNVLLAAMPGATPVSVFGNDYPTPDGTCVRDYVHVDDLADAHVAALRFLGANEGAHVFNLGNGAGFSVKQVLDAAMRVVGSPIPWMAAPRRDGDPAMLVASAQRAHDVLGWQPRHAQVEDIIESAWRWQQQRRY